VTFNERLGIEEARESIAAKQWRVAVSEVRDKVVGTGANGVEAVKVLSLKTFEGAKSAGEKLSREVARRLPHRPNDGPSNDAEG